MRPDINTIFARNVKAAEDEVKLNEATFQPEPETQPTTREVPQESEPPQDGDAPPPSSTVFEKLIDSIASSINSAKSIVTAQAASQGWNKELQEARSQLDTSNDQLQHLASELRRFQVV